MLPSPWGRGHWIGGNSILVQTGDIIDRGNASGPIFRSLLRLQDPWTLTVSCEDVFCVQYKQDCFSLTNVFLFNNVSFKQACFFMGPIWHMFLFKANGIF